MYYVYLIQSEKIKRFYVGFTFDLKQRIKKHNTGKVRSAKAYIPYKLIYFEGFRSKKNALIREKKLKHHGQGIRRLKKRLANSMMH